MVERKRPGDDALSTLDTSAEVDERDYKEGQRRKAGQMSGTPERPEKPLSSELTSMAESDEDMG